MPVVTIPGIVGAEFSLHGLPRKTIDRLGFTLRFINKKRIQAERFGRYAGDMPEFIEGVTEMPDGSVRIPRGAVGIARTCLEKDDLALKFVRDDRVVGFPLPRLPDVPLRPYQIEGVNTLLVATQGTIVLPCGCGKTRLAIGAIGRIGRYALIIVPTIDIARQWADSVRDLLKLEPGILSGDSKEVGQKIVIAITPSLVKQLSDHPAWVQRFGLVVIDEAHHVPAMTFQKILKQVPAKWRLALTATPDRDDGMTPLLDWCFGRRIMVRTMRQMIGEGWLLAAEIRCIPTDFTYEHAGTEQTRNFETESRLVADPQRNALIARHAVIAARSGDTVLILTNRHEHVAELTRLVAAFHVKVAGVTGKTPKKKRAAIVEHFKRGTLAVMVATSLADEGLDVTRLSRIILAFPQKSSGPTVQRLGRLLRKFPGKKPVLEDFVDEKVPMLARRAATRRKIYEKEGFLTQ